MKRLTPLRYPGGKASLSPFFSRIVRDNGIADGAYVEPFAGGAGVALALLMNEYVDSVFINDVDPALTSFWNSVLEHTSELCTLIHTVVLSVDEWERQRSIYQAGTAAGVSALGFALLYLNRTNRSGILNGGIIGGKDQTGPWKMDARFNRAELAHRIQRIARYRSRIHVSNQDAAAFLGDISHSLPYKTLIYLDPPYYEKGQHLYRNYYCHDDHAVIANMTRNLKRPWVVSYDDHPRIRRLYSGYRRKRYRLNYTAREQRQGTEVMFFSHGLRVRGAVAPSSTS